MKNIIVANYQDNDHRNNDLKKYQHIAGLKKFMDAQVQNSLELDWNKSDIWVVTNFDYYNDNAVIHNIKLNERCLTGSKMFAVLKLLEDKILNETA